MQTYKPQMTTDPGHVTIDSDFVMWALYVFQLFYADKLDLLKMYKTERPVNSAAISPIKDHVS